MTQLTDKERTAQMNDMRSFDEQMPCVGISSSSFSWANGPSPSRMN